MLNHPVRLVLLVIGLGALLSASPLDAGSRWKKAKSASGHVVPNPGFSESPTDYLQEIVLVPGTGGLQWTSNLAPGTEYQVVSRGDVGLGVCSTVDCPGGHIGDRRGDAAFVSADGWRTSYAASSEKWVGGLAINGALPDWGAFSPDHLYAFTVVGNGGPISLEFQDGDGGLEDNTGHLEVALVRLGGRPPIDLSWHDIPVVLSSDSPPWLSPKSLSAAASVVMVAAASGVLPAWPTWIENPIEVPEGKDVSDVVSDAAEGVVDMARFTIGHQTDWGYYLGGGFELPDLGIWNSSRDDWEGRPMAGIGGAVGLDVDAGTRVAAVLERLGLTLELHLGRETGLIAPDALVSSLEDASNREWPTVLELIWDGEARFVVVEGVEAYEDRIDLLVIDPERSLVEGGRTRYRVYREAEPSAPLADSVAVVDGVRALWAVSSPLRPGPCLKDFLLDDSTAWFWLEGEGLKWGRSFDLGLGAPRRHAGEGGWGLTWVEVPAKAGGAGQSNADKSTIRKSNESQPNGAQPSSGSAGGGASGKVRKGGGESTGERSGGGESGAGVAEYGEAVWRVLAPENGQYALFVYIAPEIDPALLTSEISYYVTQRPDEALEPGKLAGKLAPALSAADAGWYLIALVELSEEEAFVRVPIRGEPGRRMVFDGIRLLKTWPEEPPAERARQ